MVTVTAVNVFATGAGQGNTVTAPQIQRVVFLRMARSAVGEVNAFVGSVCAPILRFQGITVKNILPIMILAVPNSKLILLCLIRSYGMCLC